MASESGTGLSSILECSEELERVDLRQPADDEVSDETINNILKDIAGMKYAKLTDRSQPKSIASSIFELSEDLELFGVSKLLEMKSTKEFDLAAVLKKVISATHDMIFLHRQGIRRQDELEAKLKRILDDNRALKSTVNNLKGDLAEKDVTIMKLEEELRKAKEKTKEALAELKLQTEEVRQLKNHLKYMEKQNSHEMRRKEQELSKLQSQLSQALGLKTVNKSRNSLVRGVKPKNETNEREQKDVYQQVICKLEASNKGLLQENISMNCALQKLHKDLTTLVADYSQVLYGERAASNESTGEGEEEEEGVGQKQPAASWEESFSSANKQIESLSTIAVALSNKLM